MQCISWLIVQFVADHDFTADPSGIEGFSKFEEQVTKLYKFLDFIHNSVDLITWGFSMILPVVAILHQSRLISQHHAAEFRSKTEKIIPNHTS